MGTVAERLALVNRRIEAACARSGRATEDVILIAVTKQRTVDDLREVLAAGVSNIGENYVQELQAKREQVSVEVTWHFIGHLQRNKAARAIELSDLIHSVDSPRLAREVDKRARAAGLCQRVLAEVNVGREESKWGIEPEAVRSLLREVAELPNVGVEGIMVMAPFVEDPERVRPVFAAARKMAEALADEGLLPADPHLSMGMTNDFEVAVEEGATLVRIGTALFGPRNY